jgi:short-subunit dehydrogenase
VTPAHGDPRAPAHILITGAAGAIGGALARRMRDAWPAARLALLDRDATSMRELAAELGNASVHGVDLRDIDALPGVVVGIERAAELPLDGLVNCAGVMKVQQLQTWKWDEARDLVAIDLLAPLRLQDLLARGMTERGNGVIINVASMAGKVPLKGCTYYGASKAGLAMASEIARADLAPFGVRVVTVYPGPVKSALEQGARDAYGGGGRLGRFAPTGDPDELARRIMKALADDEPRVIYPRLYSVGWSATNLSSWVALSYGPPPVA